jgi:Arc/MetJ-type ribon-helix-helix transcriptional regulator
MRTLSITLPETVMEFICEQVAKAGASSPEEYIRQLVENDQKQKIRASVEGLLWEGLQSSTSEMTRSDWDQLKNRARSQSSEESGG